MIGLLRDIVERHNLDVLFITALDNIEYLVDTPTIGDSPLLLVYDKRGDRVQLYIPLLEYHRYRDSVPRDIEIYAVSKAIKPSSIPVIDLEWKDIILKHSRDNRVGADLSHNSTLQRSILQALGEGVIDISNDMWRARMIKTNREIEIIGEASKITVKGILAIYSELRENISENTLAGVFERVIREHGAEKPAFDPIIAFKPNNAYPHTLPGRRVLKRRDLVLVDVGTRFRGRCSDITRMITWRRPSREEKKSIEAVLEALNVAIDVIKPGVRASEVYEAAAKTLEKYGLRDRFIHGLGHGIGVVVHEPPYLRSGSETVLEKNMVFTIEPGVYFHGEYGVRVEELVVVDNRGARILSRGIERVLEAL